jgi:hypothetical protein
LNFIIFSIFWIGITNVNNQFSHSNYTDFLQFTYMYLLMTKLRFTYDLSDLFGHFLGKKLRVVKLFHFLIVIQIDWIYDLCHQPLTYWLRYSVYNGLISYLVDGDGTFVSWRIYRIKIITIGVYRILIFSWFIIHFILRWSLWKEHV